MTAGVRQVKMSKTFELKRSVHIEATITNKNEFRTATQEYKLQTQHTQSETLTFIGYIQFQQQEIDVKTVVCASRLSLM